MPYFVKESMSGQPAEFRIDGLRVAAPGPEWADLQLDNVASLKIWLPDGVLRAAKELAGQYEHSVTLILRNALIIHVYGRLQFDRLVLNGYLRAPRGYAGEVINPKELNVRRHERHSPVPPEAFRDSDDPPAASALDLRKKIHGARVFMPARLKRDLERLAGQAQLPVSQYCRELLSAYYLGHLAVLDSAA
jgi:hypothetical protein